jgi:hypothetical protein
MAVTPLGQQRGVAGLVLGSPVSLGADPFQPIVDLIGPLGGYVWHHTRGISVANEQPVETWLDVTGAVALEQSGASSLRPIRKSGGVLFDGLDDRLPARDAGLLTILDGAYTALLGFDEVPNTSGGGTSTRQVLSAAETASAATSRQVHVNYARPDSPNATRMRNLLADASTNVVIDLQSLGPQGAGPYHLAFRSGAPGGSARCDTLGSPLVQVGSTVTRPAGALASVYLTLGCQVRGASPGVSQLFWAGRVQYVVLVPANLTDLQLETIRVALGV